MRPPRASLNRSSLQRNCEHTLLGAAQRTRQCVAHLFVAAAAATPHVRQRESPDMKLLQFWAAGKTSHVTKHVHLKCDS